MKLRLLLVFSVLLMSSACQDDGGSSCEQSHRPGFAVQIRIDDSACAYRGTATKIADVDREGQVTDLPSVEEIELSCELEAGTCVCSGGDDFGRYEVRLTDDMADRTDVAILDVMREAPPVCVQTDVVQPFGDAQGAGGLGGGLFR